MRLYSQGSQEKNESPTRVTRAVAHAYQGCCKQYYRSNMQAGMFGLGFIEWILLYGRIRKKGFPRTDWSSSDLSDFSIGTRTKKCRRRASQQFQNGSLEQAA